MITLEFLREYGANVDEGLARCMNMEDFYLGLVNSSLDDEFFGLLPSSVAAGDLDGAFKAAHSLKGMAGNLSLTPLFKIVSEMTELLRVKADADYASMAKAVEEEHRKLLAGRG